jgi:hypothetical protein
MAKIRWKLTPPWYNWWEVALEHWPFEWRPPHCEHIVYCYPITVPYWPDMIWRLDFDLKRDAIGFLAEILRDPLYLADICPLCNPKPWPLALPRWNIHRGENRLWIPEHTYLKQWFGFP